MSTTLKKNNSITEGIIWKQLLIFFFPIFIGTFFQQMYNTVDTMIVGQYVGKEALAAVGATGTLLNLIVGFFVGLSSGATVIISQYYGAQDMKQVSKAIHTSVALAIAGGVLIMAIGFLTTDISLQLIGLPEEVVESAALYLNVIYSGMIFSMIYNVGTGILRALGDARTPLYILIVCCLVNIVLDLLFVLVFQWDVFGVAFATVVSQVISAILVIIRLMRADSSYRLQLKKIRFDISILKSILRIGLPSGLQSIMYSSSNLLVQTYVNSFGTNAIAAWSAFAKIDGFLWMTMNAFGIAITTFAGQNFGAGKYDRVKRGTNICLAMTLAVTVVQSVLLFVYVEYLLQLFTADVQVIELGASMLRVLAPGYFLYVFIEIFSGTIRGTGEAMQPMLITLFGICVLRIVWLLTVLPIWNTLFALALNYPVTWGITAVFFIIYYLRGNWLKRSITRTQTEQAAA